MSQLLFRPDCYERPKLSHGKKAAPKASCFARPCDAMFGKANFESYKNSALNNQRNLVSNAAISRA